MKNITYFPAIVVGGGHAGVEATFALANKGHKVALISFDLNKIAMMPCNPSIGGPAKGIITREIDALGGVQGYFSDLAMIQIKMLNESKGPAVRALRAQIDKEKYSKIIKESLENHQNISLIEGVVEEVLVDENKKVIGIKLDNEEIIKTDVLVITTGTYMNSRILRGNEIKISGPDNQKTTPKLSLSLQKLGLELQRLKTGTPARVYANSIDFSKVEKENLEDTLLTFSERSNIKLDKQISCYLTYTNEKTHQIIEENINKSAMYSGLIEGIGPRYCPSIEDKVMRFRDKNRHQIFFEPETADGTIIYVNGMSTSMPIEVQDKMLRTIPGLENCQIQKWGYAIEYDALNPLQIKPTLESKLIKNLYTAGQINGTSGYEEAAAQGLIAGINAGLKLENKEPLILLRNDAYIGVLIDDLVTKGTREPYRMLTSRAEYRLLLRNDNPDLRLSKYGYEVGLLTKEQYQKVVDKYNKIYAKIDELSNQYLSSKSDIAKKYNIENGVSLIKVLARPEISASEVLGDFEYKNELTTIVRLDGYIKKQETQAQKMNRLDSLKIPNNIDYSKILNLATEARQKLEQIKPLTIGQASRISGINPSDIQMLMFHLASKK
ncbi:tRNA uridine-5-carboxymethylaminomethyl(34) synthesis enzyme MnmG [Mycoplasmopsis felis]|uniref:tRNA uridine-5-carboxymethylaminomethyl(34) synthesis enzyme MnmG n=1 Tax=Mycoplasmopsis felis TaxID=33923 RepID=UPI002AF6B744|nr:tRNA uridine-5-carboxymethylaminomethyl(34) synthesis enzyme MnmG [Mycoplasmopsis felis]WQQ02037.1 tRNA uridine-5-carboxymethylaminomethyl(34) synthesis enzyme MnmG [Mycoplasmopsis felis]WQQ02504.1 tRNA uridine-5-carboxymethylaminomethyl(34) synthesis enzyme MnmG [Mycoplasmopsis felis]WQQ06612.1 tRNA uridine-5-carboxymethylaminomethyl(34) synthesis enzyme MnmG [Mycoplasmopsis felis]WQQ07448.1 tRNA uridine-5-carboxymethylaminomethyl(34) synthesis enzyme MnmG [Mycoplasmopsis felis]WRX06314.1 